MFERLRMHMNQVDASPGGGALAGGTPSAGAGQPAATPGAPPAAAPAATGQPPANGGAPQPPIDTASIVQQVSDGVFAALRRAGVLGSDRRSSSNATPAPGAGNAAPSAGGSPEPVDVAALLREGNKRQRTFDRALNGYELSASQVDRMERAFEADQPSDIPNWIASWTRDMGIQARGQAPAPAAIPASTANNQPPAAAPAATPQNAVPVTAGGGPPPPSAPLEQRDLLTMSDADLDALERLKGPSWVMQEQQRQLGKKKFTVNG